MDVAMNVGGLLARGGWPMVPIYACSIAALALLVHKWMQFRAARLTDMSWLESVLQTLRQGDVAAAAARCAEIAHPAARAIAAALAVLPTRPDRTAAEAARAGSLEVQRFEHRLNALSFIAQVAPLLGLFGTVVGLVDLFLDLERSQRAAVDVSSLSSGIWTALLTTAAGLAVAVVALSAHSYLAARADGLRLTMHDAIERALTAAPRLVAAAHEDGQNGREKPDRA
jgi:biopolymer transport protein ExbB